MHVYKCSKATFQCDLCDKSFTKKTRLNAHRRTDHDLSQFFNCTICGSSLKTEANLERHIRQHESGQIVFDWNAATFRCDLCGQVHDTKEELQSHMVLHENKLKCVICGTIVKHKPNLVLHMRIHVNARHFLEDPFQHSLFSSSLSDRREILPMRQMRQRIRPQILIADAHANHSHGNSPKAMSVLLVVLQDDIATEPAHVDPHRREEPRMPGLR